MAGQSMHFDVIIVGGGPAGYPLAISLARQKLKVALIEKRAELGGVCLHNGCIPSKTIIGAAEILNEARRAKSYINSSDALSVDWPSLQVHKNQVVDTLANGVRHLLKKAGAEVFQGTASFVDGHSLRIEQESGETVVTGNRIVIATGSRTRVPAEWENKQGLITSEELVHLDKLPESLAIVGGGVIGCELGSAFARFGVKVSIVEMEQRILPPFEKEQSQHLERAIKESGIELHLGTSVKSWESKSDKAKLELADGTKIAAELVLVAIGRVGNTESLHLENAGVAVNGAGFVTCDDSYRTTAESIYAIGDVNGHSMFAHAATAQAHRLSHILMGQAAEPLTAIPECVYTMPEIASIGMHEEDAVREQIPMEVGTFRYDYLGRALAGNHGDGFFKTIHETGTGKLIGLHIYGQHATELIHAGMAMINSSDSPEQIARYIWAHPTLSEGIGEAILSSFNLSINTPFKIASSVKGQEIVFELGS